MSMTPCVNQSRCQVKEHVSGSDAHRECMSAGSASSSPIGDVPAQVAQHPEPRGMTTANGFSLRVTPGVIDESAERLYTQGQCLAFATELAKKLGSNRVVAFISTDENTLIHAYAEGSDGKLYDIEGEHDLDEETERWDTHFNGGVPLDYDDEFVGDQMVLTEDIGVDPDLEYPADPYANPDDEVMSFLTQTNYLQYQDFSLAKSFAESMKKLL